MGLYVVKLQHTSEACPTANAKARERMVKGAPEIPKLAQKLGIRFVAGPLVLGSAHESIAVVETDRIGRSRSSSSKPAWCNGTRFTFSQPRPSKSP